MNRSRTFKLKVYYNFQELVLKELHFDQKKTCKISQHAKSCFLFLTAYSQIKLEIKTVPEWQNKGLMKKLRPVILLFKIHSKGSLFVTRLIFLSSYKFDLGCLMVWEELLPLFFFDSNTGMYQSILRFLKV